MEPDTKHPLNEKTDGSGITAAPEHRELVQEKDGSTSTPNGSDVERLPVDDMEGDGKINWTPLGIVATVCLSGLYVGMCIFQLL